MEKIRKKTKQEKGCRAKESRNEKGICPDHHYTKKRLRALRRIHQNKIIASYQKNP